MPYGHFAKSSYGIKSFAYGKECGHGKDSFLPTMLASISITGAVNEWGKKRAITQVGIEKHQQEQTKTRRKERNEWTSGLKYEKGKGRGKERRKEVPRIKKVERSRRTPDNSIG